MPPFYKRMNRRQAPRRSSKRINDQRSIGRRCLSEEKRSGGELATDVATNWILWSWDNILSTSNPDTDPVEGWIRSLSTLTLGSADRAPFKFAWFCQGDQPTQTTDGSNCYLVTWNIRIPSVRVYIPLWWNRVWKVARELNPFQMFDKGLKAVDVLWI